MSTKHNSDDFDAKVAAIVASLIKEAIQATGQNGWKSAFIEDRSANGGKTSISKLRVQSKDGVLIGMEVSMQQTKALMAIWGMQEKDPEKEWLGIRITALPDGKHTVEYNYDPDCINDASFYDLDE